MYFYKGIIVIIFLDTLLWKVLKLMHLVVHMKSDGSSCVTSAKREVQTLGPFSALHTSSISPNSYQTVSVNILLPFSYLHASVCRIPVAASSAQHHPRQV